MLDMCKLGTDKAKDFLGIELNGQFLETMEKFC